MVFVYQLISIRRSIYEFKNAKQIITIRNKVNMFSQQKVNVKYSLPEEPFHIPIKIRKKLPSEKNIFELNQEEIQKPNVSKMCAQLEKRVKQIKSKQKQTQSKNLLNDPLIMDSALIKSLLFDKMSSYLILISFIIACIVSYQEGNYIASFIIYRNENKDENFDIEAFQNRKYWFHNLLSFLTGFLALIKIIGYKFHHENSQIHNTTTQSDIPKFIIQLFILIIHPNNFVFTSWNYIFHLVIVLKILFVVSYMIKISNYHGNRSFRLTEIYGIKPTQNFMFAFKAIVDQMQIQSIIFLYFIVVLTFSYCLYLAGIQDFHFQSFTLDQNNLHQKGQVQFLQFSSCFEMILVTIPTVGYGEYEIQGSLQRTVILFAVIVGASLNSLITLIMLKQFQMTNQQSNSYALVQKLNLKTKIEDMSRQYIVNAVNEIKSPNQDRQRRRYLDNTFKEEYKYYKIKYAEISTTDLNSMFQLFKDELKIFKIKSQQMNNMIKVLLAKFYKIERQANIAKRSQKKKLHFH